MAMENGICSGNHEMQMAPSNWYAPKKSNIKAWNLIASGNIWWNKKKVDKYNQLIFESIEYNKEFLKRKRRDNGHFKKLKR